MNNLQTFSFNNQSIRTVQLNNQPYWVLKDVCDVLELTTPSRVAERLEEDEVSQTHIIDALGRIQNTTVITESGLYAVILRSDKPNAKEFRKWVTSEVLPAIRKNGAYATPQTIEQMINNPDFTIQLLTELKKERESVNLLAATVKEYEPKVSYYDKILKNKSLMNTTVIAQDYGMCCVFNTKSETSGFYTLNIKATATCIQTHSFLQIKMETTTLHRQLNGLKKVDYFSMTN